MVQVCLHKYGDASYWDERYAHEPTCFDWYQKYDGLEPIINQHFKAQDKLLQVGVGTSHLQYDLVTRGGFEQILNIDISRVCIEHMQQLHKHVTQLKYRVGDVRCMPEFKDDSFDGIVDKGTLDAILCGEHAGQCSCEMLQECHRVLKPGGCLMVITYGEPSARLPLLKQEGLNWHVSFYVIGKCETVVLPAQQLTPIIQGPIDAHTALPDSFHGLSDVHFVYVCCKESSNDASTS